MKKSILALPVLAAMAATLTFSAAPANSKAEKFEVREAGEPISCISLRNIKDTDIIDNSTIDFKMAGGKTYRNTLRHSCSGLKSEDRFTYRVSGSQLCSVDMIHVLEDWGGRLERGAGCSLGKFQPVERVSVR